MYITRNTAGLGAGGERPTPRPTRRFFVCFDQFLKPPPAPFNLNFKACPSCGSSPSCINNCDSRDTHESHDNALSLTRALTSSEGPGPESLQGAPCPLRAHIARFRARKVRSRRVPKRECKRRQGVLFKLLLQGGGLFPAGWHGGVGTSTY